MAADLPAPPGNVDGRVAAAAGVQAGPLPPGGPTHRRACSPGLLATFRRPRAQAAIAAVVVAAAGAVEPRIHSGRSGLPAGASVVAAAVAAAGFEPTGGYHPAGLLPDAAGWLAGHRRAPPVAGWEGRLLDKLQWAARNLRHRHRRPRQYRLGHLWVPLHYPLLPHHVLRALHRDAVINLETKIY